MHLPMPWSKSSSGMAERRGSALELEGVGRWKGDSIGNDRNVVGSYRAGH